MTWSNRLSHGSVLPPHPHASAATAADRKQPRLVLCFPTNQRRSCRLCCSGGVEAPKLAKLGTH